MKMADCKFLSTMILNAFCAVVVVVIGLMFQRGIIGPYRYGFSCDDRSIRYPYRGDTIPTVPFILFVYIFSTIFIALVERIHYYIEANGSAFGNKCFYFPWKTFLQFEYVFLQGAICCYVVEEVSQFALGGLRPHFFDSCKPEFNRRDCASGYVTNYTCSAKLTPFDFADMYKTFPSGHAIGAAYCSIFACVLLNKRLFGWPSIFLSSVVQLTLLILASYCSVTRLRDHRHHASDIIAGTVIGFVIACYTAMWLWTSNPESDCNLITKCPEQTNKKCTCETRGITEYGQASATAISETLPLCQAPDE